VSNLPGVQLRAKRVEARISGAVLCIRAGIGRGRLSEIERGQVVPSHELLCRVDAALDALIGAKRRLTALAEQEGWPVPF
jgi:transcriptional regulator with XRE-family HTH domain